MKKPKPWGNPQELSGPKFFGRSPDVENVPGQVHPKV